MKILIVSDTHRKDDNLERVIKEQVPLDMLIRLLEMVMGNNDFFSCLDKEIELTVGPHKILLTHGHYYNVSLSVENLYEEAVERGCDIAMYGHTHRPYLDIRKKVTILNPGSLSYPRQEGRKPSYMIMTMDADGTVHYDQRYLEAEPR